MVWNDSCRVVDEWFARLDARADASGDSLDVDTVQTTLRMALVRTPRSFPPPQGPITIGEDRRSHNGNISTSRICTYALLATAQMIISAAAFGQRPPWPTNDDAVDPPPAGRKLGFITALHGALEGTVVKLLLPTVRPRAATPPFPS